MPQSSLRFPNVLHVKSKECSEYLLHWEKWNQRQMGFFFAGKMTIMNSALLKYFKINFLAISFWHNLLNIAAPVHFSINSQKVGHMLWFKLDAGNFPTLNLFKESGPHSTMTFCEVWKWDTTHIIREGFDAACRSTVAYPFSLRALVSQASVTLGGMSGEPDTRCL